MLKLSSKLHVLMYRLSGGRLGKAMNGLPVLLLSTTGRKSGVARTKPVVFLREGEDLIIAPGVLERPDWYLNLKKSPRVTIQIGNSTRQVQAIEADPEERSRLWEKVPEYWRDYQKKAKNELPLIILRAND
jgi:deazaflavin-dependent oxidoreductase (nitroreductase family)